MRTLGLALAFLLVGCADPAADNYGWGWGYDEAGATGLRLRYAPDVPAEAHRPLAAFETAWTETAACLGVPVPTGPLVIVTAAFIACEGHADATAPGCAYPDTRTAVVMTDLRLLRHEYVHLLLGRTDHAHPGFDACGLAGPEAEPADGWPKTP